MMNGVKDEVRLRADLPVHQEEVILIYLQFE